jgi:hypothetical protein
MRNLAYWYLAAGLLLAGCDDTPARPPAPSGPYWAHTQGFIRQVDFKDGYAYVRIETEEGQLFTVKLLDGAPPVWVGLHGRFAYEANDRASVTWKNFQVEKRLP